MCIYIYIIIYAHTVYSFIYYLFILLFFCFRRAAGEAEAYDWYILTFNLTRHAQNSAMLNGTFHFSILFWGCLMTVSLIAVIIVSKTFS